MKVVKPEDMKKDELDDMILEKLTNGKTKSEIAKILGLSSSAISYRINRMQYRETKSQKTQEQIDYTSIAKEDIIRDLMELKSKKNATDEQLKQLGAIFGITESDFSEALSNDER